MSRKSRFEYVGEKRRAYARSEKAKRSRILDEVCETLDDTRKYVIKLLTGNIRYRERKGRGRTYGTSTLENARRLWESVGCPCTTYFVSELPRSVREYEECVALIKPKEDKIAILSMSASTLGRAFKGLPRIKPFATKCNRRSGVNRPILDAIECKSGEEAMVCHVRPALPASRPCVPPHVPHSPRSALPDRTLPYPALPASRQPPPVFASRSLGDKTPTSTDPSETEKIITQ